MDPVEHLLITIEIPIKIAKHKSIAKFIQPNTPNKGVPVGLLLERVSTQVEFPIIAWGIMIT